MRTESCTILVLLACSALGVRGLALPSPKRAAPFDRLVAFGDQLTDNGNGSYAHGLDPQNGYGYHTYTDGPIAVSYLSDLLDVPLIDYAWGGTGGAGLPGPTVNNAYTEAKDTWNGKPVPSTQEQIFDNYTRDGAPAGIHRGLHFLWVGMNDIKRHTNWYAQPVSKLAVDNEINTAFYRDFTAQLIPQAERLAALGAPAVMVANIYPINRAPETYLYFCHNRSGCVENWGAVIEEANRHIQAGLAASKYADKFIYYDVYGYMTHLMANKDKYGFTAPLSNLCDGGNGLPIVHWDECTSAGRFNWAGARPYFWFNAGQPSTVVHELIAKDMKKKIDAHFGI